MLDTDLRKRLAHHGLEKYAEKILPLAKPRFNILEDTRRRTSIGSSRLSGVPDLPTGFKWPSASGVLCRFVAQFNLKDLPNPTKELRLPESGLLSCFVADDWTGKISWGDDGWFQAFYFPEGTGLRQMSTPNGVHQARPCSIKFELTAALPYDEYQFPKAFKASSDFWDSYDEFWCGIGASDHYLLGYPRHNSLAYNPTPGPEWTSLLTLASSSAHSWTWHDGDHLMAFIRANDLAARAFGNLKSDAG